MATPSAVGKEGAHVEHAEHLSIWPILVGLGALLTYIGLVFRGPLTVVGFAALVYALLGWVREDTKLWPKGGLDHGSGILPADGGWWGMIFFLATEVMLFGGLFATYFVLRGEYPQVWAEGRAVLEHSLPLVTANTIILLSSGATLHYGVHAIKKGNRTGLKVGLFLTIVLGAIFLGIQAIEYRGFISEGLTLSSGAFGSIFYMLTGTHGFHVLLGVVFLGIMFVRALLGQFDEKRHVGVDAFAIYWHFVDVVWIFVFLTIYLGVI